MKRENKNIGFYGEELACAFLKNKNYLIISRNFQSRHGEIDIISKLNNIIIFTEVKSRYSKNFGRPLEAVTPFKQHIIKNTASYFLYTKNFKNVYVRFDVIEVIFNYFNNTYKINHIENAF